MAGRKCLIIMAACLAVATYNSQGHGADRLAYIKNLCINHDFVFVQEHWLFKSELSVIENKLGVNIHGTSGMKENALLIGRPFGGCAIIWKPTIACEVIPIASESSRMCAVHVKSDEINLLLCNTDIARVNSAHTQSLNTYMANECLKCCDEIDCCNVDYTYMM